MIKGLRYIIKCKCLLFRGHQWFYRAFIFCYFSTVFITVNLKAFLPFVFFQLPKLNIKTCRVVPEPLRRPGSLHYYKYLQIVVCTSTHRVGFYWAHARGVYCLSVLSLLVGNCPSQCGESSSSQQQHCVCSIAQVGLDLDIPQILMEMVVLHFISCISNIGHHRQLQIMTKWLPQTGFGCDRHQQE